MNTERTLMEIRQTRKNVLEIADTLSLEEINTIPAGFNNNIVWHLGHLVASQQILCYKFSGLPMYISSDFTGRYGKGSKPQGPISQESLEEIKSHIEDHILRLESDLKKNIFTQFASYQTSYGILLENMTDTLQFMKMHEALHLGYIMAQKRALLNST